jgi:hypothetical protein
MNGFSPYQLIDLWESGEDAHPILRPVAILAAAWPDRSPEELAGLGLGQRDALLLELRELTLGREMPAHADCPACGERLTLALSTDELRSTEPTVSDNHLSVDRYEMTLRPLTTNDLLDAALRASDEVGARAMLVAAAVTAAAEDGAPVRPDSRPEPVVTAIADRLVSNDPLAEVLVNLTCPGCGAAWPETLDVASYFWAEIRAHAERLVWDVHTLAHAYGWSEDSILTMSNRRRQAYLELIEA